MLISIKTQLSTSREPNKQSKIFNIKLNVKEKEKFNAFGFDDTFCNKNF